MLTVVGTTVNAASRLEALTKEKGCQLIAAADVFRLAGLPADAFRCEETEIRGLSAPRPVVLVDRARDLPDVLPPPGYARSRA
jgi:adenylate cyclase